MAQIDNVENLEVFDSAYTAQLLEDALTRMGNGTTTGIMKEVNEVKAALESKASTTGVHLSMRVGNTNHADVGDDLELEFTGANGATVKKSAQDFMRAVNSFLNERYGFSW